MTVEMVNFKNLLVLIFILGLSFCSYSQCEPILTVNHTNNSSVMTNLYFYGADWDIIDSCLCNDPGNSGYYNCADSCLDGLGDYIYVEVAGCKYTEDGLVIDDPLPIELIRFTAIEKDDHNLIGWITATEQNNDFFTIQKCVINCDNPEFFMDGPNIDGAGNSSEKLYYFYKDTDRFYGRNYYRLKQTDYDGVTSYSGIIYVQNEESREFKVWAYNGDIVIENVNSPVKIIIHSTNGTKVHEEILTQDKRFQLKTYTPGVYLVTVGDTKSYSLFINKNYHGGKLDGIILTKEHLEKLDKMDLMIIEN